MLISDWSSYVLFRSHSRHAVGPATLDGKQQDEDDYRQRYDDGLKSGIYDRKTLDRRQHRNRRSDHAVAIKERCCEHAQHDDTARPSLSLRPPADERDRQSTRMNSTH